MSNPTLLEQFVNDVKDAIVEAKKDGRLELSEIIKIATVVSMKARSLSACSLDEKKALVSLALKKGLEAATNLTNLAAPEQKLLDAGLAAVHGLMGEAPQLFVPAADFLSSLKCFLSRYLRVCSSAAAAAKVFDPKDSALIAEALAATRSVTSALPKDVSSTLESLVVTVAEEGARVVEKVTHTLAPVEETVTEVKDTPEPSIAEKEPSLEASPADAPSLSVRSVE